MAGVIEAEQAYNLAQMIADYGSAVIVRNVTTLTGPSPSPNPPNVSGLVVSGTAAIGASLVTLRATRATGRLLAGDVLRFAGDARAYAVTAPVIAVTNGFSLVPITPALVSNLTDGQALTLTFSADVAVQAFVTSYPARLVNGTSIQNGDIKVRLLVSSLPFVPAVTDKIFVGVNSYSIVNVHTMDLQGVGYGYSLQARGGLV